MTIAVESFQDAPALWDRFVRSQAGWTHFHLYGWRRVIEHAFRHECIYLAARDDTRTVIGVLPLVRVKSLMFGHYLISMPFLNYGGPLGAADAVRALTARAVEIADTTGVKLMEFRSRRELPIPLPASHRKLTVVLDLPSDAAALWKALPTKLRSQIKRPRKDGVEVRFGREQLDAFYAVFSHHMRDLGTPTQSRQLFETIADVFPDDVHFAVAYHGQRPVACGCGFLWNGEFEITWASALHAYKAMSPNMLVYWEFMERMTSGGGRLFNFGRSSPDSGTYRFKMQWGGRAEPLWWYYHARHRAPRGDAGVSTPQQDKGIFALATRVWQRLPLAVATRLGPSIVRFIP